MLDRNNFLIFGISIAEYTNECGLGSDPISEKMRNEGLLFLAQTLTFGFIVFLVRVRLNVLIPKNKKLFRSDE